MKPVAAFYLARNETVNFQCPQCVSHFGFIVQLVPKPRQVVSVKCPSCKLTFVAAISEWKEVKKDEA